MNQSLQFPNQVVRRLLVLICLVFVAGLSQSQSALDSQADFELSTGRLCFPVLLEDDDETYSVCMDLEESGPGFRFSLVSAVSLEENLTDIATYNQQAGLVIPIVRFSNNTVYAEVPFTASLDSSTGQVFLVSQAEKILRFLQSIPLPGSGTRNYWMASAMILPDLLFIHAISSTLQL